MPNDLLYIGTFAISRTFLDVLAPLIGTIIGGLITYFTTQTIEKRKWQREREVKYLKQYREAIEAMLNWINPVKFEIEDIEAILSRYVRDFESNPDLTGLPLERILAVHGNALAKKLAKREPSLRLRALLDNAGIYSEAMSILKQIDDLSLKIISDEEDALPLPELLRPKYVKYLEAIKRINTLALNYYNFLTDEYKKTYLPK